jgi:hypothetical protein
MAAAAGRTKAADFRPIASPLVMHVQFLACTASPCTTSSSSHPTRGLSVAVASSAGAMQADLHGEKGLHGDEGYRFVASSKDIAAAKVRVEEDATDIGPCSDTFPCSMPAGQAPARRSHLPQGERRYV